MYVNGINILAFDRNGVSLTTRWNLDELVEWNLRHIWHTASSGAILADVYFQLIGNEVEVSWYNEDTGDDIKFRNRLGGVRIKKTLFLRHYRYVP